MAASDEIMRLDMVEKSTMQAILEAPVLPKVTADDNGKFLLVDAGKWVAGASVVENIADSSATTVAGLKENFNALLAALKAAGIMAADEEAGEATAE